LLIGLVLNVALDLVLLPSLGLHGAVMATTAANFVALTLVYVFSWRFGMRIDAGTWLLSAAPTLLWLGPWAAAVALVVLLIVAGRTRLLFSPDEKRQAAETARGFLHKFHTLTALRWPRAAAEAALEIESS
jgi:peptidoglycan biosynthesis protein MviN/MurJ (putative lipid II flippase)